MMLYRDALYVMYIIKTEDLYNIQRLVVPVAVCRSKLSRWPQKWMACILTFRHGSYIT